MDIERFNAEHAAKSRAVCERIEREDADRRGKLADLMDAQLKGELGRAKAEADGWRGVADRRLKHIEECEAALAKRNGLIVEPEKRVKDLEGMLRESDQLTERERAILDMWPRFEDGEYVWFGDAVKIPTCGSISAEAIEFSRGKVCVKDAEDGDWGTSMCTMHPLKRPAPEVLDADGVEIKVGDTVRNEVGTALTVIAVDGKTKSFEAIRNFDGQKCVGLNPAIFTHTPPDSWERLEEDAVKDECDYFGFYGKECDGCPAYKPGDCDKFKSLDLIRRAKALAGVEVPE